VRSGTRMPLVSHSLCHSPALFTYPESPGAMPIIIRTPTVDRSRGLAGGSLARSLSTSTGTPTARSSAGLAVPPSTVIGLATATFVPDDQFSRLQRCTRRWKAHLSDISVAQECPGCSSTQMASRRFSFSNFLLSKRTPIIFVRLTLLGFKGISQQLTQAQF
jgi:hypothetical protein